MLFILLMANNLLIDLFTAYQKTGYQFFEYTLRRIWSINLLGYLSVLLAHLFSLCLNLMRLATIC